MSSDEMTDWESDNYEELIRDFKAEHIDKWESELAEYEESFVKKYSDEWDSFKDEEYTNFTSGQADYAYEEMKDMEEE